jgi:hypothetical protein
MQVKGQQNGWIKVHLWIGVKEFGRTIINLILNIICILYLWKINLVNIMWNQ